MICRDYRSHTIHCKKQNMYNRSMYLYLLKYYLKATSYINDAIKIQKIFNQLSILVPYV